MALLAFGGAGLLFFPLASGIGLSDPLYFVVFSLALLAPLLQLYRGQGFRLPDVMLLGFMIAQFVGGLIQALTDADDQFSEMVSTADFAFVVSYLLAFVGLAVWVAEIKGPARMIGGIDAAVLLTGLLLMGGQFLLYPTMNEAGHDRFWNVPSLLRVWYPICAYLLLALLVWVSAAGRPGSSSLLMLEAGFTTWALAESAFHLTSRSLSVPEWWVQVLWLTSYLLIGAGIAYPDKGRLATGGRVAFTGGFSRHCPAQHPGLDVGAASLSESLDASPGDDRLYRAGAPDLAPLQPAVPLSAQAGQRAAGNVEDRPGERRLKSALFQRRLAGGAE